jgi:hypothetical protein
MHTQAVDALSVHIYQNACLVNVLFCCTAYLLAVGVKQYKLCRVSQLLRSSNWSKVIALIAHKAAINIMTQWTCHYNRVPL